MVRIVVGNSGLILDLSWVHQSSALSFEINIFMRNGYKDIGLGSSRKVPKLHPCPHRINPVIEHYLPKKGFVLK